MEDQYPAEQSLPSAGMSLKHVTLRVQLEQELAMHRKEMARIQQLLELIDKNPAIEQFVNLSRGYRL